MSATTTIAMSMFVQELLSIASAAFLIYLIGYSTFLFLSVTVGSSSLYRRKKEAHYMSRLTVDCYVPVSILVPAYNEGVTVVSSVRSLLSLDYSLYEVVVVDDGSSDDTAQSLIEAFDLRRIEKPIRMRVPCEPVQEVYFGKVGRVPLTLVRKGNGGKADALNMGINAAQYPYFICIDADSALQSDSLTEIVAPLIEQDNVVAVGGQVRPSNGVILKDGKLKQYALPKKVIPAMQALEYDRSFLSARILFDQFNGNLIISGAFGLFRKDVVVAAGGYDRDTVGEDMEIVMKLHAFCRANDMDYRIAYAPDAICWSQAPENLRELVGQRKRWHRGLFESMSKYRSVFMNRRFGLVSLVSYTYFLIYELFSPVIELAGLLVTALAMAFNYINTPFMVLFFLIYALFGSIMSLTAFFARTQTRDLTLTARDALKAVGLSLIEVTVLRFIMSLARMTALVGRKAKGRHWERVSRTSLDVE